MRKVFFVAAAASIMITQTGCFGSFNLVKKVYELNEGISDNKVVKTLFFYLLNIVPIYGAASFLDIVIFNLIEFWSGSNPISMNEGEVEEQLMTIKGDSYKVTATKNKMSFEKIQGEELIDMGSMVYSPEAKNWSMEKDGESQELISFNNDNSANFNTMAGFQTFSIKDVEGLPVAKVSNGGFLFSN